MNCVQQSVVANIDNQFTEQAVCWQLSFHRPLVEHSCNDIAPQIVINNGIHQFE